MLHTVTTHPTIMQQKLGLISKGIMVLCSTYIFVYSGGVYKFKYLLINDFQPQIAVLCLSCKIKGNVHSDSKE